MLMATQASICRSAEESSTQQTSLRCLECRHTGQTRKAHCRLSFSVHCNGVNDSLNGASCTAFFHPRKLNPTLTCVHCCYFRASCSATSRVASAKAYSKPTYVFEIAQGVQRRPPSTTVFTVSHITEEQIARKAKAT